MNRQARADLERKILTDLSDGPAWKRSYQPAKPIVDEMIARGLIEPVRPIGGKARNMIGITAAGREELAR